MSINAERNEEDTAWKNILDNYLKDFIEYCFPELNELIDWSYSWERLDKELLAITRGDHGKQLLDKLFEVKLTTGHLQWILVHVEVQAKPDKKFSERMFVYGCRSYDKYRKPIISLAVLTDSSPTWRPNSFKIGLAGSYIKSRFLVIKVTDYKNKKDELNQSNNLFAHILFAQLAAIEAKKWKPEKRKDVKIALVRRLFTRGLNKKEVEYFLIFIDWLIGLPSQLAVEYVDESYRIEEMFKMPYITTFERIGIQKGIEQGIGEGIEKGIKKGIEQGIEKGIEIGIDQGLNKGISKNAREVATRMLERGFLIDDIIEITMLNRAEVISLQNEISALTKVNVNE